MTNNQQLTFVQVHPETYELSFEQGPLRVAEGRDVLIKIEASGINRPDLLQRKGGYPAPKGHSPVLGLEAAGEIIAVGENVSQFKVGDKVAALLNGGGYATHSLVPEGNLLPKPANLSMIEAASLPETVFTVWHNIFERGGLKRGEWLLIHGGTSGIGVMAIQMAKAFGAHVIATAGSSEKCEKCRELGADLAINYKEDDFVPIVKETANGGFDVCLDMVGGDYIARNIKAAKADGRIVQIAFLKGAKQELNLMSLMLKRLTLTGSTLRSRTDEIKEAMRDEIKEKVWPLIENGTIKPVIYETLPFKQVSKAHDILKEGKHMGKIILTDLS